MRVRPTRRLGAVLALTLAAAVALSGCVAETPEPTATPTASTTPAPEASETAPMLRPGENAVANRQFFDQINTEYFEANGRGDGRSIVDNLIENGFEKQDMEVTADTTAIGLATDSIVVSVRIKGECLLGQFAPDNYVSSIEPLLGTGGCLVGKTRAIDW
ncbi:hypothetical protein I6E68_06325 [Salinibacterium sp. NSLL150]|uniref:DUF6993 domain-containing protein n=1 Tax=unclassified Salinibacterium TaxID=2632331 RepID=UPI0018CD3819|nr:MULTISPECIES: hypothetical protein [unclassified Salinibacterium]MBH0098752.1 hypothetical protein [Salinibacterium sp. NSLL35]MBH0101507.1 hypothetical protein [Salinibacterium sp. NSLL150]MBH0104266.1 hypothetical protein [Salinibacterium sp. NSLL16]MBH0107027.1 hypothetical protein [Salinibacterium sp. NSLL17]